MTSWRHSGYQPAECGADGPKNPPSPRSASDAGKRLISAAQEAKLIAELEAERARADSLEDVARWFERARQDAIIRADKITAPEDAAVLVLCRKHGFGAVIDSAARQWAKQDPSGAFFVGGCIGDKSARAALGDEADT